VNGLLIIDKPAAMTSHDVVACLRRFTGESSIGHLGTLDPMATGVLPLLVGKYTRLAQFFGSMDKTYTGTIRFGFSTNTYDSDGVPSSPPREVHLSLEQVRDVAQHFQGEMEQTPPIFSAKKVDGKPAYQSAREGKAVVLKPVRIRILKFEITGLTGDTADFAMSVSAGGYVRSVAHEMGEKLGCGAHLASLRRTQAGPFTLDHALTFDQMSAMPNVEALEQTMPHPRNILPELPCVGADEITAGRIRNGGAVNLPDFSGAPLVKIFSGQKSLLAIGKRIAGTLFQPVVVLG
jgi:tRNA pseudouridine55 synthase